jgi:hypothetical protein
MRVLSSPFLKPAPLIFERIAHPLLLPNSGSKLRSADRGIADPIRVSPLGLSMTQSSPSLPACATLTGNSLCP